VSLTNDLYLRVRGNIIDEPTHIHFDTGNNQYFNQFIGDDLKYIQLANTGNIVINSNDAAGNSAQWTFDTTGNATFPANGTTNLHDVVSVGLATFSNVQIGGNLNYAESANLIVVEDKDGFADIIAQNKNSGGNASMNIVLVNNDPGNVYMTVGVNSSTFTPLYNTLFEIPDAGYVSHSTTQVLGPQSAESGVSKMYFTYSSGSLALELNDFGAIGWGASYNGNLTQGNFGNTGQVLTSAGANSPPTWNNFSSIANGTSNVNIATANGNVTIAANASSTWTFSTSGNLSAPGNVSAVGNVTGGNILTGGLISATGNVTGGNLATGGTATATGNVTGGNLVTAGLISATGNVTGGNLVTAGLISATGNITAGNLSVTGNVIGTIGFTGASITINNAPGGNEGAEIQWALPSPANTVLNTSLIQDVFQNGMRFFESGGNSRGLYMDLGNVPNGAGTAVGYRDIPQVSFTANATLAATDAGRHYYSTLATANTLTIANNTSVSWSVGTAISIVNRGSGNITIAQGSGVSLYLAGNSTPANRTVTTYGMATLLNVAANVWMINGTGVS